VQIGILTVVISESVLIAPTKSFLINPNKIATTIAQIVVYGAILPDASSDGSGA